MAKAKKQEENQLENLKIDKTKIVNEIKKEIKESLDEEIIKKVDYETQNKLDKMEKRIYRQKRWAVIRRDIIILLFLGLIIYEGKILYDNGLLFGLNEKEDTKQVVKVVYSEDKEEEKDSAWYIEKYSYLLDNIKTNLSGDDKYYIYNNLKVSDIKNSVKLNMAYQLLNVKSSDGIIKVSEDDIKEKYNTIFGAEDYNAENFSNDCISFIYNKDLKTYMAIDITCESDDTEIFRKITNIYEENDNIIIEAKVGIFNKSENKITIINGETLDYNDENIEKLKTYKFIFNNEHLIEIISE